MMKTFFFFFLALSFFLPKAAFTMLFVQLELDADLLSFTCFVAFLPKIPFIICFMLSPTPLLRRSFHLASSASSFSCSSRFLSRSSRRRTRSSRRNWACHW